MYRVVELTDIAAVRSAAAAWDDLWQRGENTLPLAQAEPQMIWCEQFVPDAKLRFLAVADGDKFVAALPLFASKAFRFVPAGKLPVNMWSLGGDLLLDPQADWQQVLEVLINQGLRRLSWPLLWLENVVTDSPRWLAFFAAAERAGLGAWQTDLETIAAIDLGNDWDEYFKGRSRNHRRNIRRARRDLNDYNWEFNVYDHAARDEIEPIMRKGFEVERRSWKNDTGAALLNVPGMFEFYLRQAHWLAEQDQLFMATLEVDGEPIAYHHGYFAKRCYSLMKVAYDDTYAKISPGHQLTGLVLEWLLNQTEENFTVDFLGKVSRTTSSWLNRTYPMGRIVVAPGGRIGRGILTAYRHARPWVKRLRDRNHTASDGTPEPKPTRSTSGKPAQPAPSPVDANA